MSRNEADTRADLIDPKLKQNGWGEVDKSYIRREVICPGRIMSGNKHGASVLSDYVLVYQGRKLAVVEAKREGLSYTEGVRQAKDYATRLQCRIAYATNGCDIYQIDLHTAEESLVDNYMSPEQLWEYTFADSGNRVEPDFTSRWRKRFSAIPFDTKSGSWAPRYYQDNAINNALDAIAQGSQRILLTLATGTGKTAISFQIAWKLFNSRWSLSAQKTPEQTTRRPRILFLADRNILADQAFNDFGAFGDDAVVRIEPTDIKKKGGVPKNASVFFTIFQTFMSGKDQQGKGAPYFGEYPADFFDFIIIDECHRGGANNESSWRGVLEYFAPAVQLGLTATPKRRDNVDTYAYFGDPVYSYTLKEGVNDGFLTPFKVIPIVGTMDEYIYTPGDGVVVKGEPEPGKLYKEADFNWIIKIPAREEKRVQYWMDKINPKEKTIVFCAKQAHAGVVRDLINQYAVKRGWTTNTNYCVRVTAKDGKAGEVDLRMFQDNEKTIPTILTTSRKLSTGVDARNIRNIVLMRPCKNMIEFKQIIGRGTRIYDDKDFFTVYDFVKAHHNFADPEWDGEPLPPDECKTCGESPCSCEPLPCSECGFSPCGCENISLDSDGDLYACEPFPCNKCGSINCHCERCANCGKSSCICSQKIVIKLSDGKTREIQHVSSTMYWSPEGTPVTGEELIKRLFGDLPQFFKDEEQLRMLWSDPNSRKSLLSNLADAGYDLEKLESMKDLIDAKDSDVYDVLAYVAYATETHTRKERVLNAQQSITAAFADDKSQAFIEFVSDKYVEHGVQELDTSNLKSLLDLQYGTTYDAEAQLGSTDAIKNTFVGFQKYLYAQ